MLILLLFVVVVEKWDLDWKDRSNNKNKGGYRKHDNRWGSQKAFKNLISFAF